MCISHLLAGDNEEDQKPKEEVAGIQVGGANSILAQQVSHRTARCPSGALTGRSGESGTEGVRTLCSRRTGEPGAPDGPVAPSGGFGTRVPAHVGPGSTGHRTVR